MRCIKETSLYSLHRASKKVPHAAEYVELQRITSISFSEHVYLSSHTKVCEYVMTHATHRRRLCRPTRKCYIKTKSTDEFYMNTLSGGIRNVTRWLWKAIKP